MSNDRTTHWPCPSKKAVCIESAALFLLSSRSMSDCRRSTTRNEEVIFFNSGSEIFRSRKRFRPAATGHIPGRGASKGSFAHLFSGQEGENEYAFLVLQTGQMIDHIRYPMAFYFRSRDRAVGASQASVQQFEVVMYLSGCAHG